MRFLSSLICVSIFALSISVFPPLVFADILSTGAIPLVLSGQDVVDTQAAQHPWASGLGTLHFTALGDFDDGFGERVDLYLDGIFIATAARGLPGTTYTPGTQPGMKGLHRLESTFNVDAATMQAILGADSSVTFRMDLSPNVGATAAFTGDFVLARISYSTVPEPSSIALLGLVAAGGFTAKRRFLLRRES